MDHETSLYIDHDNVTLVLCHFLECGGHVWYSPIWRYIRVIHRKYCNANSLWNITEQDQLNCCRPACVYCICLNLKCHSNVSKRQLDISPNWIAQLIKVVPGSVVNFSVYAIYRPQCSMPYIGTAFPLISEPQRTVKR